MNRAEVLDEVTRMVAPAVYLGEAARPLAEEILAFLDDIGYNAGPELSQNDGQAQPAYCMIHESAKWCRHNGGVLTQFGWSAPNRSL